MADQLKHPATIIAGVNTVVLAAGIYYVYQQISGLKSTVADLERQLANLKITLATIKDQDVNKGKMVRETNEKVNTIGVKATEEIGALSAYISAMNADLHGLVDQLNNHNLPVELLSVSSALANYQGEMHFPNHGGYAPLTPNYLSSSGTSSNIPVNNVQQSMPWGRQQATLPTPTNNHAHLVPPLGQVKSTFPMPGGRAPHPQQMQMRMGPGGGSRQGFSSSMMAPSKPKDPDPIGDLVDQAQNQSE